MDPVIEHLWSISPLVGVLGIAVWYFHRRDQRNEERSDQRHKACEERNTELDRRIQSLEERQFDQLQDLAERGIAGLTKVNQAIRHYFRQDDTPTAVLPAVDPKETRR